MIRGGKGGAATNRNGLAFEKETSLEDALVAKGFKIVDKSVYRDGALAARLIGKNSLYLFLQEHEVDWRSIVSAKLLPDEAIYSMQGKSVTIVEKKWQEVSGSVDEKLQTCGFKLRQYTKLFEPLKIDVKYVYLLNDWFAQERYTDVLAYIKETGADYHFNTLPLELLDLD